LLLFDIYFSRENLFEKRLSRTLSKNFSRKKDYMKFYAVYETEAGVVP